jgi:hypothetical protein
MARQTRSGELNGLHAIISPSGRGLRAQDVRCRCPLFICRLKDGDLVAGAAQEATSATAAERGAGELALKHAGAVAFSRTGDSAIGDFQDAVVLARFGDVDLNALRD